MYFNREYKSRFRILKGGLVSLVVATNLYSAPSGGIVVSGEATINKNGNTTNINQSSQKASINWQEFNIKSNEIVNFNQPNSNSITLNRVVGTEKSIIDGALNANGQVWLINSNGTIFNKNAKVNTAGLLVTTKELSDKDFQDGKYNFKGDSTSSIENNGTINLKDKAYATFIANSVINNGKIEIYKGNIHLVGASDVTINLDENSNISLKVNKGVIDALVENNHLLIVNGGNVYLTTNAKNELLKGVVNNRGIIEANSLEDIQGEVILFAHGGTANIAGEIKAKNSFVETSGENLSVKDSFKIEAKTWLLDPTNIVVGTTNIGNLTDSHGDVTVSNLAIQNALNSGKTQVKLEATNNITVNENISWSTESELRLKSDNINVNATINNTNKTDGGVYFEAANTKDKVVFGANGKVVVNNIYQLQWINQALNGKYELGSDINASATSSWDSNRGFNPIGSGFQFAGTFDGKGFTISDLYINRTENNIGLFGHIIGATIKNIGLENVNITGQNNVGGLVGDNEGTIENSYASGSVSGSFNLGGLVGVSDGTISNSYASGSVSGSYYLGGLVGVNRVTISNSYASGAVNGYVVAGGLVGGNAGTIENSYASGSVSGSYYVGGLVGDNEGTITNSFYDNSIHSTGSYGRSKAEIATLLKGASSEWETDQKKGRGYGLGGTTALPFLKNVTKLSNTLFEDGLGTQTNPYTITNWTQLQNINNSNILTKGYYLSLVNNLSNQTSDYSNFASSIANNGLGWNPIGNYTNKFNGIFDGLGNTISNLYISRNATDYIGLFGLIENSSTIKNIGLENVNITGQDYVGGLVGINRGTISNSYATGNVTGSYTVGGLVGGNLGTISNSYASGSVSGGYYVGGLVGISSVARISNSYATGSVTGDDGGVGGLVGGNLGTISNSYASGIVTRVSGNSTLFGGLVGNNGGTITSSFYDKEKNTNYNNGLGIGKTTTELQDINTFKNAGWTITVDSTLAKGTPMFRNGSWVIGTKVTPNPTPSPSNNNQKQKIDENVQRVISSIEPSTNSSSSSNQSLANSLNSNIRTLSFNSVGETKIINGGVKMPENIVNNLNELESLEN